MSWHSSRTSPSTPSSRILFRSTSWIERSKKATNSVHETRGRGSVFGEVIGQLRSVEAPRLCPDPPPEHERAQVEGDDAEVVAGGLDLVAGREVQERPDVGQAREPVVVEPQSVDGDVGALLLEQAV